VGILVSEEKEEVPEGVREGDGAGGTLEDMD
jgi:hypothetical protein